MTKGINEIYLKFNFCVLLKNASECAFFNVIVEMNE